MRICDLDYRPTGSKLQAKKYFPNCFLCRIYIILDEGIFLNFFDARKKQKWLKRWAAARDKKSVDLSTQITIFRKWLKMGKNRTLENGDRPTFFKKTLQKWLGWGIMAVTNGVNAVVVPSLWGIETFLILLNIYCCRSSLYLPYEGLKRILDHIIRVFGFVVPSLWGIETWSFHHWTVLLSLHVVPSLWGIDTILLIFHQLLLALSDPVVPSL